MNVCLICRRFFNNTLVSIDDTIDQIQIKNLLNDLNFKLPFDEYKFMSKVICMECCCNLEEFFVFRDNCCELLFEYVKQENNRIICRICCKGIVESQLVPKTSYINDFLMNNSDICRQVCSYDFDDKCCDNLCTKCYQYLIRVYGFYLKCNESLNFWTNHVLKSSIRDENLVKRINLGNHYECKICFKSFLHSHYLKKHLKIHTAEKSYKCVICLKSFKENFSLKKHLRTHTDEKPFKCKLCFKSFRQSGHLMDHIKIHAGDKLFKCEICLKSFLHNSTLKNHIRIHTGEKPYTCEICFNSFTESGTLKRHLRIHEKKAFKCNTCSKSYSRPDSLKAHLKVHISP